MRIPRLTPLRDASLPPILESVVCLDDHGDGTCEGTVLFRLPLTESGRSFPRCAYHWNARLDEQERISERYPDSDVPPADFDPAYAGERWDEDE